MANPTVLGSREESQLPYDGSGGDLPPHKKRLYDGIRDAVILDIGCGTGAAARFLAPRGNSVFGIAGSIAEADVARPSMREVLVADLDEMLQLPFEGHAYDAILLGDVIEHLKYPLSLLRLAAAALKPGGRIFISVPNVANIRVRLGLLVGDFRYEESGILDKTHLRFFTIETIRRMVGDARLEIEAVRYSNWNWSLVPRPISRQLRIGRVEQAAKDFLTRCFPGLLATQVMLVAKRTGG